MATNADILRRLDIHEHRLDEQEKLLLKHGEQLVQNGQMLSDFGGKLHEIVGELAEGKRERHEFNDKLEAVAHTLDRTNKAQDRRDIIAEAQATFLKEQVDARERAVVQRNQNWSLKISFAVALIALLAFFLQAIGVLSHIGG